MRPYIALCLVSVLLLAFPACDRGGDNSVTGMDGTPVALRLQSVTGGASDFVGEELPFAVNPEGCSETCGDEDNGEPKYVEIMVSVDGGDAETIYNGDYSDSLTVSVPNGEVTLLALIYNCDCCEVFAGYVENLTLPGDGGEVTLEMWQEYLNYVNYSRDEDGDGHPDENIAVELCQEPVEEEGWVPECLYLDFNCDCDDTDSEIHKGVSEVCDDGIDNDCDGYIDCFDDGECSTHPACN